MPNLNIPIFKLDFLNFFSAAAFKQQAAMSFDHSPMVTQELSLSLLPWPQCFLFCSCFEVFSLGFVLIHCQLQIILLKNLVISEQKSMDLLRKIL